MFASRLFQILFAANQPIVTFLDFAEDVTDLTVYTFTAMNMRGIGSPHPSIAAEAPGTGPLIPSTNKSAIVGLVAGEDALTVYTVSSATIGGVAGTKVVDRGGGAVVSCAIFLWDAADLAGITNTDVVVTWSEAITGCCVCLVKVDNLCQVTNIGTGGNDSTGTTSINLTDVTKPIVGNSVAVFVNINADPTQTPNYASGGGAFSGYGGTAPFIFHQGANAEFAYVFSYRILNQTDLSLVNSDYLRFLHGWTGAAAVSGLGVLLH